MGFLGITKLDQANLSLNQCIGLKINKEFAFDIDALGM